MANQERYDRMFAAHMMAFGKCSIPPINFIDKSLWPDGPWQSEPDRVVWDDADTGLPCIINRDSKYGFLCGYVGIPDGHKLHGIHADDISLDVHGGINFSGTPLGNQANRNGLSCLNGFYWLGFMCDYSDDWIPTYTDIGLQKGVDYDTYRSMEYVKAECRKLAAQLGAI